MEEKLLLARVEDAVSSAGRKFAPAFLGFLSESEAAICQRHLARIDAEKRFFGGYDGALRSFLCVSSYDFDDSCFPIRAITFTYRKQDRLSHRDFLGSLMALGLTREKIGDILVEDGRAVVFAEKTAAKFILSQIEKVGRVGVALKEGFDLPLPEMGKKAEFSDTVASARLDCVVAALCSTSRNKAAELIEKEMVSVNSFLANKVTQKIESGDTVSIRKKGRFDIKSIDGVSKKGRTVLIYDKYI